MADTKQARPKFCTDEHLEYLDGLRESGVTNMYGAAKYLDVRFPDIRKGARNSFHSSDAAQAILSYWMDSFGKSSR